MKKGKEFELARIRYLASLARNDDFNKYFLSELNLLCENTMQVLRNPETAEKEMRVAQGKIFALEHMKALIAAAPSRLTSLLEKNRKNKGEDYE